MAEADKDQIVLEKMDDPGQKLVLKNKVKLEEEKSVDVSTETEAEMQTES